MVKGISRRVVVIDSPDQRFFEQAIFIVRNDAAGEGITSRELVEEARRVARNYASGDHGRFSRVWRNLSPAVYTLMGAAAIGLIPPSCSAGSSTARAVPRTGWESSSPSSGGISTAPPSIRSPGCIPATTSKPASPPSTV